MRYVSKPQFVEAVQWTGSNMEEVNDFAVDKAQFYGGSTTLQFVYLNLLAGKDGAQDWVPVPVGYWLVCKPGDKSDIWPVDPDYFQEKYHKDI